MNTETIDLIIIGFVFFSGALTSIMVFYLTRCAFITSREREIMDVCSGPGATLAELEQLARSSGWSLDDLDETIRALERVDALRFERGKWRASSK